MHTFSTDGSYFIPDLPPTHCHSGHSKLTRRYDGKAFAAIIGIGDPDCWRAQPLIVLRILVCEQTLLGSSAYTAEPALVRAVQLVRN